MRNAQMHVLGIVPARGGSKGVPRKNIRNLCGRPLLAYTADAARSAVSLAAVVLSTDDEEIAAAGRQAGLEVPFLRPGELAGDSTPTLPVLQHAVAFLESSGRFFDAVCLLQPTNPLRRPEDIDACVALLSRNPDADSVISVVPVPHEHNPHWVYFEHTDGSVYLSTGEAAPIPRRQLLPPAFCRDGSIYVVRRDVLMNGNSLYGSRTLPFHMPAERAINIDTDADWQEAVRRMTSTEQAETACTARS